MYVFVRVRVRVCVSARAVEGPYRAGNSASVFPFSHFTLEIEHASATERCTVRGRVEEIGETGEGFSRRDSHPRAWLCIPHHHRIRRTSPTGIGEDFSHLLQAGKYSLRAFIAFSASIRPL